MGITKEQRDQIMQAMAAQLQDNYGQRLTQALVMGICATLDATWPRPEPIAQPPEAPKEG
jgi:hypothetical protein